MQQPGMLANAANRRQQNIYNLGHDEMIMGNLL
jgi:hypothetical protein